MFKHLVLTLTLLTSATTLAYTQSAADLQSAQPDHRPGETDEQHGARLLADMLKTLGGQAWLNKRSQYIEAQTASFFRGEPTGAVTRYVQWKQFAQGATPEETRIEFVSYRGLIEPGTVRKVAHLWTADQGLEYTYKGRTELPEKQVKEYFLRRDHSLETVMTQWVKQPGTVILYSGAGERDRRQIEKVTILTASNDAVTIEIEQGTHWPLQRSFEVRNEQFKDHDLDEEVFGDWRLIDGIGTPMNTTEYKNGDMAAQIFFKKVTYNQTLAPNLFNPDSIKMTK